MSRHDAPYRASGRRRTPPIAVGLVLLIAATAPVGADELLGWQGDKVITYPGGASGPGSGPESGEAVLDGVGRDTDKDNRVYPPASEIFGGPAPDTRARPGYRETTTTAISGMRLTRVSDNRAFGTSNGKARHAYSRRQAWSRDGEWLLIGDKLLDTDDYSIARHWVPLSSERVWMNRRPASLVGVRFAPEPNQLARYDAATDRIEPLRTFPDYRSCTLGDGEGSLSYDDRRLLLVCQPRAGGARHMIAYDLEQDRILGRMPAPAAYNWAGFSPSGRYIVVEHNRSGHAEALWRYDADFSRPFLLTDDRHHGDFGLDAAGRDVFVMISWDRVSWIRLDDGALSLSATSGADRNWIGHGHLSCRSVDRPGWCYVSAGTDSRIGAVRIENDGSGVRGTTRLGYPQYRGVARWEHWGFHRSSSYTYDAQPKASVDWTGTRVVFTSDWRSRGEIHDFVLDYSVP